MDPLSHVLVGAAVAKSFRAPRAHFWALALIAEWPDLDVFFPLLGFGSLPFVHRSWTHSISMSAPVALATWGLLERWRPWHPAKSAAAYVLAAWSHVLFDWMTSYGTPLLWPFYSGHFSLDWLSNLSLGPLFIVGMGLAVSRYANSHRVRIMSFTWLALAIFLEASSLLQAQAAKLLEGNGVVHALPDAINPLEWRLIAEDLPLRRYRLYVGWPLSHRLMSAGVYDMPSDSSWVRGSLADPQVRTFLKSNRWPLARAIIRPHGVSVEWGNLLFFWGGRVRGKLVVDMDTQARVVSTRRVFEPWDPT